ncbi:hypothetical protein [Ferrimonas senticii]|uniref:hypothetical protein n=1 Tax=Ferrimonas senticii TaxID=394566 RepID=UPI000420C5FE|nr:hypothetical protein [Ferrimonas senticii]
MKLHQQLRVGDRVHPLLSITAALTQGSAGRAIVTCGQALAEGESVQVELAYAPPLKCWMTATVESCQTLTNQTHRLILREPAARLAKPLPLSMLHPTLRDLLDAMAVITGLTLECPESCAQLATANLTHRGTGYALMAQLGVIFGIDNYTWFSKPNGTIWLGSWEQSHWASNPIAVDDKLYAGERANSGVQLPMLPAIRPDTLVNGNRVQQLLFDGSQLTLQWYQSETAQQRELQQHFPELGAQTHLSQLARVINTCEPVVAGHLQTAKRPALAVDVQLINPDGSDNTLVPPYRNVPLPGAVSHSAGQFTFAQPGTIVELGFAFGHSHRPFVRTVLGEELSLPQLANGDSRIQQGEAYHHITSGGDQLLHTEHLLQQTARTVTVKADSQQHQLGAHQRSVEQHDIEQAQGHRTIAANWLTLLGLSGTRIATEKTHELLAGENLLERVAKLRKSVATTHWAGSDNTNIYQLLHELMAVVEQLASSAASHTHIVTKAGTPTTAADVAGDFSSQSGQAKNLGSTLAPMI